MLIDWSRLLPALLCLLPPIALAHSRRVRCRALSHGWSGYWGRTLGLGLHTIDLGRATLGAWWLTVAVATLPDAHGPMRHGALAIQGAILAVAVGLQTFVSKTPGSAQAPFAFVAGIVVGFLPPLTSSFSLCLAVALAVGLRSPAGFFPFLAFTVLAIGLFFAGTPRLLPLAALAGTVALPWLLTLLFPRELVLAHLSRRSSRADATRSGPA